MCLLCLPWPKWFVWLALLQRASDRRDGHGRHGMRINDPQAFGRLSIITEGSGASPPVARMDRVGSVDRDRTGARNQRDGHLRHGIRDQGVCARAGVRCTNGDRWEISGSTALCRVNAPPPASRASAGRRRRGGGSSPGRRIRSPRPLGIHLRRTRVPARCGPGLGGRRGCRRRC